MGPALRRHCKDEWRGDVGIAPYGYIAELEKGRTESSAPTQNTGDSFLDDVGPPYGDIARTNGIPVGVLFLLLSEKI